MVKTNSAIIVMPPPYGELNSVMPRKGKYRKINNEKRLNNKDVFYA